MIVTNRSPLKAKIHLLLPEKEHYTRANAGAVAMVTEDMILASRFDGHVFGRMIKNPPLTSPYTPLVPKHALLVGGNIGLAKRYLEHLDQTEELPNWVEVHGRCQVASYLARKRSDLNVVLVLHNDPRHMKGAKTISERRHLSSILKGVFAVSQYLLDCFVDGLDPGETENLVKQVVPLGIDKRHKNPPKKKKQIVLTGRMVAEKGMLEAAKALAQVLPHHPDWSVRFIGARGFKSSGHSPYEKAVAKAIAPCGQQASMLGFLPRQDVARYHDDSAIAIVPSLWQEPAGRVVLEAISSGCALITTRRGGIPEYAENRALIIDEPSVGKFADAIDYLISTPEALAKYQKKVWKDYPFTRDNLGQHLDEGRLKLLSRWDCGT
jgi:glycosyltransferase involved in cell wall biosynthesis